MERGWQHEIQHLETWRHTSFGTSELLQAYTTVWLSILKLAFMEYKSILDNSCLLPPTVWCLSFLIGYSSGNWWKNSWQFSYSSLFHLYIIKGMIKFSPNSTRYIDYKREVLLLSLTWISKLPPNNQKFIICSGAILCTHLFCSTWYWYIRCPFSTWIFTL